MAGRTPFGHVGIQFDEKDRWIPKGWIVKPLPSGLAEWVRINIGARNRPFILLDSEGEKHNLAAFVNARVAKYNRSETRLYVVYVYNDGGKIDCRWGELLIVDGGPRFPLPATITWWSARVMFQERVRAFVSGLRKAKRA